MAEAEPISVAAVEPELCPDDDIAAIHAITQAIARETGADEAVEPFETARARIRSATTGPRSARHWLARDHEGNPLGAAAFFWTPADTARRIAGFGVDVLPAARRRGVGTRLFAQILDAAIEHHKTFVQTWTLTGGVGEPFLDGFGARLGSISRRIELDLATVDRALLAAWVARAPQRASDYSLVEWTGPVPRELRDDLVRVMFAMNTAPTDGLAVDECRPTLEQLAEQELSIISEAWETRGIAARYDPSGLMAGYTTLGIPPDADVARQGDTVVEVAHRNRGLGRWLKARMLLRLLNERPDVRRVRTDNAASNAAMLSINEALGFRTIRSDGIWQVPVEPARRIAQARFGR